MQQNQILLGMIFKKKKEDLFKEGTEIALDNSQELYEEAKILYDNKHYARGFALAITSLEESAKALLFLGVSFDLFREDKTLGFVYNHENKLQQSARIISLLGKFFDGFSDLI